MRIGEVVVTDRKCTLQKFALQGAGTIEADSFEGVLELVRPYIAVSQLEDNRKPLLDVLNEILTEIEGGAKIEAMKVLRNWSGGSLIDCKHIVERIIESSVKFGNSYRQEHRSL